MTSEASMVRILGINQMGAKCDEQNELILKANKVTDFIPIYELWQQSTKFIIAFCIVLRCKTLFATKKLLSTEIFHCKKLC